VPAQGQTYQFGAFAIRPDSGELWHGDRRVRLAPQPFQVLALIVQARGELVTRDAVRNVVWADGTTVEFDQGLNYCLRQIRIALRDDARSPTYIETVPKRGYRLLAAVSVQPVRPGADIPAAPPGAAPLPVPAPHAAAVSSASRTTRGVFAVAAAGAVAAFFWWGTPVASPPAISADAQRLFREAEHLSGSWEQDKVIDATERYRAAIAVEPGFAAAWAGLTNANIVLSFASADPARNLDEAEVDARRALALDPKSAIGHAALGHIHWHQWRWREADEEFRRAVEGDDGSAVAHHLYGLYLASVGRGIEARAHAQRAVALDPVSGLFNYSLAQVLLQAGDFEAARRQAEQTLTIDRHYPHAYATVVRASLQLGQYATAAEAIAAALQFGSSDEIEVWQAYQSAVTGDVEAARRILSARRTGRARPRGSIGEAAVFVALGERDAALTVLEEAVDARVRSLLWLATAPELAPLRGGPRFKALLSRVRDSGAPWSSTVPARLPTKR